MRGGVELPGGAVRHRPARALGLLLLLTAGAVAVLWRLLADQPYLGAAVLAMYVATVIAGVLYGATRERRSTGVALVLSGTLWLLGWYPGHGALALLIVIAADFSFAGIAWAIMRAPTSRSRGGPGAWLPAAIAVWAVAIAVFVVLVRDTAQLGPTWLPAPFASTYLVGLLPRVAEAGGIFLTYAIAVALAARRRRTDAIDAAELFSLQVVTVLSATVNLVGLIATSTGLWTLQPAANRARLGGLIVLVALTFLLILLDRWLARTALVDLVLDMAGPATPASVTASLRTALRDPGLELLFRDREQDADAVGGESPVGDEQRYIDALGRPVDPPVPDEKRIVVPVVAADGTPLALMVAQRALRRRPYLVDAAVAASALSLENARLQAIVLSRLEQVSASRERIIEAGRTSRLRLRDELRDGTERRLRSVGATLDQVLDTVDEAPAADLLVRAREQLELAFADLRDLVAGVAPAVLVAGGLRPALAEMAARLPIETRLRVTDERFEPAAEAAAYFVASEALANVAKHARAGVVRLDVHGSGDQLSIEIRDDGVGGARVVEGGGLAGLADRVAALGGEVAFASPPGEGTLMTARIPCV